ncbi:signal transducer and activator of transcription 5A-like [Tropilaelaps mercedesae]|uniref:Signal transducer and activator of transcription n=1 Tax=Tropilaelaps mercedesae TaxID=418985 RepID=A0A1V9XPX3_9ACAR|nr:signal transducer and activator of transcription 5A-like [Tropilaelaps mercedesae]
MEGGGMATWERIQRLPERFHQQMQQVYGAHMPIEVRQALSDWIDSHDWQTLNPDNPDVNQYVPGLVGQFMHELEEKTNATNDFVMRIKLTEALTQFKQDYSNDPSCLIRVLRNCIICEQKIIAQYEASSGQQGLGVLGGVPDPTLTILQEMDECRRNTQLMEEQIKQMHQKEEAFVIQYQDMQKHNAHLQQLQTTGQSAEIIQRTQQEGAQFEVLIKESARDLHQARLNFEKSIRESVQQIAQLQHHIVNTQLAKWHHAQQLAGNGQPFDNNLDQIQEWCEELAGLIWRHLQLVHRLEFLINKMPTTSGGTLKETFSQLENRIKVLLSALVCGTFVIEKQPPQVMKTNTRFCATVRLLVGGQLNVHMSPPEVRVSIISEAQALLLARNDGYPSNEVSGEILNNVCAMEYHQASKQLSVSFRNMSLKRIRRAEKKGTESVMDEKFCLLFQSSVKVGDITFSVQARSLPVVVIVHGNQEPHARATVTWDNAFSEQQRQPFVVPECVTWSQMAHVLSTKFHKTTGRGLSESNLHFLATKAFRNPNLGHDFRDHKLSWALFCKEQLPERGFTFWEWFYAIMKVTKEHLRLLWNDGVVWGFVSRREAEDMLLKKPNGTFLLRFSDSELGGVSIAWVADKEGGGKEILMVQPFTSKDFQIRSLADRISDLHNILYLYPDTVKDQAFAKYYTRPSEPQSGQTNGYIKPMLITQIPGIPQLVSDSDPATPQPFYAHSESQNMYAGGLHDATFGDPNSMQLYPLTAAPISAQRLKRFRDEDFCTVQQVSN